MLYLCQFHSCMPVHKYILIFENNNDHFTSDSYVDGFESSTNQTLNPYSVLQGLFPMAHPPPSLLVRFRAAHALSGHVLCTNVGL